MGMAISLYHDLVYFTCDVRTVLHFIKENWGNNKKIIGKEFPLKLKMLIVLTTASRAIEMHQLNILKIYVS